MAKSGRISITTGPIIFGAFAFAIYLAPTGSEALALPLCEVENLNLEISKKVIHLNEHTFTNTEFIRANNGAVYTSHVDGVKRIVRFGVAAADTADFTRIAELMSESQFGVQLVGVITAPPSYVIRTLGIEATIRRYWRQENLADITKEVTIFEYIDGLEVKGKILSGNKSFLHEINWHAVIASLEAFLQFCNSKGILIGSDFAYFVTPDSRVIFFDWDYYQLSTPKAVEATNNKRIAEQIAIMKSRAEPG